MFDFLASSKKFNHDPTNIHTIEKHAPWLFMPGNLRKNSR